MSEFGTGGPPKRSQRALIDDRRTRCLVMRLEGHDDVTIGRQLRAPSTPDGEGCAGGYNPKATDEALAAMVRKDVQRALEMRRARVKETAVNYVEIAHHRLEALYAACQAGIDAHDPAMIGRAVQVLDKFCKLHGLYAPVKVDHRITSEEQEEISGAVGELIGEIETALGRVDENSSDVV